jgi:hypothetical protein
MHDANGTTLSKGDLVYLLAEITELSPGEDFCNVSIKSLFGRRPDDQLETVSAINTAVLVLHKKAD